ncbi:MAG: glycosyl hydrolase family 53 [Oscillospiraceae bacterium]|nr:glycosyl hydrolase family 53 [Oscillospiraceae bacterium]
MIKGYTYGWDSRKGMLSDPRSEGSIIRLSQMGCNWAALAFAVTQERFSSTRFGFDFRFCNTDREIEKAIENLKKHNMKVCLKPVLNCEDGTWRANISFPEREFPVYDEHGRKKSYWNEWFSCYTAFILHYAEIAEYTSCEMLCIGCEMVGTEHREEDWRELIAKVRNVYHGPLVYNANHGKESNVKWFDALDYIGTSAYYPVGSPEGGSTAEEMLARWEEPRKQLRRISEQFGKKVIFMEIGCRSAEKCASMPWDFTHIGNARSEEEQANFYESALRAMWDEDYFAGYFWWDWPTLLPTDKKAKEDTGFMIFGKKAEQLLTEWYKK